MNANSIIFDMDGVLINSEEIRGNMWREAARTYHFPLSEEEVHAFVGSPDVKNAEYCYQKGCDRKVDLLTEQHTLYKKLQPTLLRAYDGVKELLDLLDSHHITKALASTTRKKTLERSLKITGLFEYFPIRCSGDEVVYHKPAPDIYLLALKKLSADPKRTIAIEDSLYGVKAAKAAGLYVFGYLSSYSREALLSAGADETFSEYSGMFQKITEIYKKL